MEQDAPRQVPYDVDIEQALLGAILVDNYSLERVSNTLKAEHFYDPLHQRLYDAIERMWARGHAVTPLTLKAAMEQDTGLAEVGGHAYLISLARAAPALPNVKDYARILADLAMRRELIRDRRGHRQHGLRSADRDHAAANRSRKRKRRSTASRRRAGSEKGRSAFDVALPRRLRGGAGARARRPYLGRAVGLHRSGFAARRLASL